MSWLDFAWTLVRIPELELRDRAAARVTPTVAVQAAFKTTLL
jgi:hypothetical protein